MSADNDNLDDLFRQQLGQHATPPGPDLQRRLAELAEAERLDALFRTGLGSHASQPRRELWERLEDEHLRPQPQRRRRVAAWWPLSAAAVLLLTLLAGGLWQRGYWRPAAGPVASQPGGRPANEALAGSAATTGPAHSPLGKSEIHNSEITINQPITSAKAPRTEKSQQNDFRQATAPAHLSSSHPIATTTRPGRSATARRAAGSFQNPTRRPDAAAGQLATTGGQKTPAGQRSTPSPEATTGTPAAARDNATLALAAFAAATAPAGVIEVDVRRGAETTRPAAAPAAAVVAEVAPRRRPRLRLGGLLRQADHLVHGESVSLAEATGLPETLTVHARLGGRTLSKTIAL